MESHLLLLSLIICSQNLFPVAMISAGKATVCSSCLAMDLDWAWFKGAHASVRLETLAANQTRLSLLGFLWLEALVWVVCLFRILTKKNVDPYLSPFATSDKWSDVRSFKKHKEEMKLQVHKKLDHPHLHAKLFCSLSPNLFKRFISNSTKTVRSEANVY